MDSRTCTKTTTYPLRFHCCPLPPPPPPPPSRPGHRGASWRHPPPPCRAAHTILSRDGGPGGAASASGRDQGSGKPCKALWWLAPVLSPIMLKLFGNGGSQTPRSVHAGKRLPRQRAPCGGGGRPRGRCCARRVVSYGRLPSPPASRPLSFSPSLPRRVSRWCSRSEPRTDGAMH